MSDIHGDFESLDKALEIVNKSHADVLTISGDLNGENLDEEDKKQFYESYRELLRVNSQINQLSNGQKRLNCYDTANLVMSRQLRLDNNVADNELMKKAANYLSIGEKAKGRIIENYNKFRDRFSKLEQKVFVVPGDWDTKCMDDVLAPNNLHLKYPEEVGGFKFIGYGGASEVPFDIPQESVVDYNIKEEFDYLCQHEDASIVLTHVPPTDFEGKGSEGNPLLLAYLYRMEPDLILCGHNHVPFALKEPKTGTIVVNPGLLGKYKNEPHGTFLEIDVDEYKVSPVRLYSINGQTKDL